MNNKEYHIKVHGNSGCDIKIISSGQKPAVKKSTISKDYAKRLIKQRRKQQDFHTTIKAINIPKVIEYDDMSFTMEYLHMMDAIEFLVLASPSDIKCKMELVFKFIADNLGNAKSYNVNPDVFLEKLNAIEKSISPEIWQNYYNCHVNVIRKELPENLPIHIGKCHGDLTLSNIMFCLNDFKIGFIDFLDSFIESPIVDIVKLRQDTKFNWTNRYYKIPHDTVKISIIMSWLDSLVKSEFCKIIDDLGFRIIEKMNYLRIAPYAQLISDHEYLSNALRILNKE